MRTILEDFSTIKGDQFLYILPIGRFNIKEKFKLNNIIIYPQGCIEIIEAFKNHIFLDEDLQKINIFKENSLAVFCEKSPVDFSAQAANNLVILNFAVNYLSNVFDYIIFHYCNINNNKTLPGRIGQISSGESLLMLYAGVGDPRTRIICEKTSVNTITLGNGLFIDNLNILNSYPLFNPDLSEVGNVGKHALRMYVEMLESNSLTDKFIHIIRLFEFIASPNGYEKFQNVKTRIIAHIAKNRHEIHAISEDFKYYSSGDANDGLRTQIIHNGKKIEELVNDDIRALFKKLHRYLYICITDLIKNYNKDWTFLEELRVQNRQAAELNKNEDNIIAYSSTLILIDGDYLSKAINQYQQLYKEEYPSKNLDAIELNTLCYEILLNTHKWEENKTYSFLIFHLEETSLPFVCEIYENMNNQEIVSIGNSRFQFQTFHNHNMESLIVSINTSLEDFSKISPISTSQLNSFESVILCGENELYKKALNSIKENSKEVILIIDAHLSSMGNCGFHYFDVGHLVGKVLGLKYHEL